MVMIGLVFQVENGKSMLDELQEHVEAIDMANIVWLISDSGFVSNLHFIRGLVPLLGYLNNSHANIRAKAAKVATTYCICVFIYSDCNIVYELGFPRIMLHLASSEDVEIAQDKTDGLSGKLVGEDEKLKQLLQDRINGISSMSPEDLGAAKEKRHLVDSLWITCYNKPSSLRDKGHLVLPEEDAPPPDVPSMHFEPPLRAWATTQPVDKSLLAETKKPPLLLGLGPTPSATPEAAATNFEVVLVLERRMLMEPQRDNNNVSFGYL
ncbi:hypothetical protein UlMin_024099 [Ulmus minor]